MNWARCLASIMLVSGAGLMFITLLVVSVIYSSTPESLNKGNAIIMVILSLGLLTYPYFHFKPKKHWWW